MHAGYINPAAMVRNVSGAPAVVKHGTPGPTSVLPEPNRGATLAPHPNATPTGSNRSDTSFKRWQARESLSTQLKDRGAQGPVRWTRSLTDVQVANYRNCCRENGDRQRHMKRGKLPGAVAARRDGSTPAEEYIYRSGAAPGPGGRPKVNPAQDTDDERASKEYIRHVTIAELHQILETSKTQQRHHPSAGGRDDMKIVIDSVPNAYPNIKVTFKDANYFQEQQKGVKLPAVGPVRSAADGQRATPASQTRNAPKVEPVKPATEGPLSAKACLKLLDQSQHSSTERTKRWVQQNPLGPAVNEEYGEEDDKPELMRIRPLQGGSRYKSAASSESTQSVSTNSVGTTRKSFPKQSSQSPKSFHRQSAESRQSPQKQSVESHHSPQKQSVDSHHSPQKQSAESPKLYGEEQQSGDTEKGRKPTRRVRFGTNQFLLSDPNVRYNVFS